ncbi:MAG: hypothetical protein ACRD25_10670 [Terracidiphilus sp.]
MAFSSSPLRFLLKFFPARFIKNVNMRIPELGPFGDTFFDARDFAIVSASFVKSPGGGKVETVFTFPDHRFGLVAEALLARAMFNSPDVSGGV